MVGYWGSVFDHGGQVDVLDEFREVYRCSEVGRKASFFRALRCET